MAAFFALLLAGANSAALADRPIIHQEGDSSCGLAAVSALLAWSGRPVAEEDLRRRVIELLEPDTSRQIAMNERGLKVRELIALISDLKLSANGALRSVAELRTILRYEPVLVLAYFSENSDDPGHFTVIEAELPDGSFLLADPALDRVRLTEQELEQRFARKGGRGISFVLRTPEGRPIVPNFTASNPTTGPDASIPSLQTQLTSLGTLHLEKGKVSVELDFRKANASRFTILDADGIRFTSRQATSIANFGVRYGLTEDTSIGASVPIVHSSETLRLEVAGESFEDHGHTTTVAPSVDLQLSSTIASSENGALRLNATASTSLSRKGRVLGGATGIGAVWFPGGEHISTLSAHVGLAHARPTEAGDLAQTSLTFGSSVVARLRPNLHVIATAQREVPLRTGYPSTRSLQFALNVGATNRITLQPYISLDRTGPHHVRGVGVAISYQWPRDMF